MRSASDGVVAATLTVGSISFIIRNAQPRTDESAGASGGRDITLSHGDQPSVLRNIPVGRKRGALSKKRSNQISELGIDKGRLRVA